MTHAEFQRRMLYGLYTVKLQTDILPEGIITFKDYLDAHLDKDYHIPRAMEMAVINYGKGTFTINKGADLRKWLVLIRRKPIPKPTLSILRQRDRAKKYSFKLMSLKKGLKKGVVTFDQNISS